MDESAVSFRTPEVKQQSMLWVEKGQTGATKAQVHASRMNQMLQVFFNAKGIIYTS
jgi:hypothetical protein